MNNPVNSFLGKINEHLDYDLTFLTSSIEILKSDLESLLVDVDVQVTKNLMEAIGYQVLNVASQHIIVEKSSKRVALLFSDELDKSIDVTVIVKVNRETIKALIFDYLLDYLCDMYDTLTFNVAAFQHVKGIFYHNE